VAADQTWSSVDADHAGSGYELLDHEGAAVEVDHGGSE
jgi:hypothetical protein